jgi:hypothetical protein
MTLLARQASVRRTLCSETESHDLDGVAEVAAAANSIDANQGFDRAGALHYVRTVKESGLDFFDNRVGFGRRRDGWDQVIPG